MSIRTQDGIMTGVNRVKSFSIIQNENENDLASSISMPSDLLVVTKFGKENEFVSSAVTLLAPSNI